MEKQLYNISDEAMEDLEQIFDSVMVNKVISKTAEHHNVLKSQLQEVKKNMELQQKNLEKIDSVIESIGNMPISKIGELENSEEYLDKSGKYTLSSVMAELSVIETENNSKIRLLQKNIGMFPLKDSSGNIIAKSMAELHLKQLECHETSKEKILEEISMFSSHVYLSQNEIIQVLKDQTDLIEKNRVDLDIKINEIEQSMENSSNSLLHELYQLEDSFLKEMEIQRGLSESMGHKMEMKSKMTLILVMCSALGIGISIILQLLA